MAARWWEPGPVARQPDGGRAAAPVPLKSPARTGIGRRVRQWRRPRSRRNGRPAPANAAHRAALTMVGFPPRDRSSPAQRLPRLSPPWGRQAAQGRSLALLCVVFKTAAPGPGSPAGAFSHRHRAGQSLSARPARCARRAVSGRETGDLWLTDTGCLRLHPPRREGLKRRCPRPICSDSRWNDGLSCRTAGGQGDRPLCRGQSLHRIRRPVSGQSRVSGKEHRHNGRRTGESRHRPRGRPGMSGEGGPECRRPATVPPVSGARSRDPDPCGDSVVRPGPGDSGAAPAVAGRGR